MNQTLLDYYRCPEEFATCLLNGEPSPNSGYFSFGPDTICYGSTTKGELCTGSTQNLYDAFNDSTVGTGTVSLCFDPDEAIENLRLERYCSERPRLASEALASKLYYFIRPLLGVCVRRHLQRFRVRNWRSLSFPNWPVDRTVEQVHETLLRLCLKAHGEKEIPFIWFWPEGLSSCVSITHDVETTKGRDYCSALMDLDESCRVKSSFQLVPEVRYSLSMSFLESIRSRGFELNVHDLTHDGRLFVNEAQFRERANRINQYARAFGARGFRSGALYRNLAWYEELDFSYDMSVPNTAHLDPQRGGCCTAMPYFIGNIIELPLTTTQDYSLCHILNDYSFTLWRQQLEIIRRGHGIATFNIHPDYIIEQQAKCLYMQLLRHVEQLRDDRKIWLALPGDVEKWWRNRAQMRIIRQGGQWIIQGCDSHRARLVFARLRGEELEYSWTAGDCPHSECVGRGDERTLVF